MTYRVLVKLFTLAALATATLSVGAHAGSVSIVSNNSTWIVTDPNNKNLGFAQNVCLNATAPANCPTGPNTLPRDQATLYGYPFPAWTADLTNISGAKWIWAPNITGTTSPAANQEFTFATEFLICGPPKGGTIWVAADNSAEVLLNGTSVLTSTNSSQLSKASIPAASLKQSPNGNTIQIKVKNGANPSDCGSDQYQCNPAGVVFGASFEDTLTAQPYCTDSIGKKITAPGAEQLACPTGEVGNAFDLCICVASQAYLLPPDYSQCMAPPPTCIGTGGRVFAVNQVEMLACLNGQVGSAAHTCQANGTWSPTASTCSAPPPTCTGMGGKIFPAGATETLSCPITGQTGSASHTCLSNGSWSAPVISCNWPLVAAGAVCGARDKGITGTCPSGTTCGPRLSPPQPRPLQCALFGLDCPVRTETVDWYCDPP